MDLMMMVVEMTLISLVGIVVESHESLEGVRSTLNSQHQFRIQIQVRYIKAKRQRCLRKGTLFRFNIVTFAVGMYHWVLACCSIMVKAV
jgi:hypothetical protein